MTGVGGGCQALGQQHSAMVHVMLRQSDQQ
jgi:hypothetical protein